MFTESIIQQIEYALDDCHPKQLEHDEDGKPLAELHERVSYIVQKISDLRHQAETAPELLYACEKIVRLRPGQQKFDALLNQALYVAETAVKKFKAKPCPECGFEPDACSCAIPPGPGWEFEGW